MAGYSGGRKVIAPGIAHADTIRTFHSARFMEDPAAIQCNLAGNPLHEEQLEIVRMLGRRLCGQHRDRRGPRSRPRQFRRSDRKPPRGGRVRRRKRARSGGPALRDDRDFGGGTSARRHVLPDGEGHGDAARYPGAGRHADRRLRVLRGLRLAGVPRGAGAPARAWSRRFPADAAREAVRRRRRVADRDAIEVDARRARAAFHHRPRCRGAKPHRRRHRRFGRRRACGGARARGRSRVRGRPRRTLCRTRSSADADARCRRRRRSRSTSISSAA